MNNGKLSGMSVYFANHKMLELLQGENIYQIKMPPP